MVKFLIGGLILIFASVFASADGFILSMDGCQCTSDCVCDNEIFGVCGSAYSCSITSISQTDCSKPKAKCGNSWFSNAVSSIGGLFSKSGATDVFKKIGSWTVENVQKIPVNTIATWTKDQWTKIPFESIGEFTKEQVSKIPVDTIATWTKDQWTKIPFETIGEFTKEQVSKIPVDTIATWTKDQWNKIPLDKIADFTKAQIASIPFAELKQLSKEQLAKIDPSFYEDAVKKASDAGEDTGNFETETMSGSTGKYTNTLVHALSLCVGMGLYLLV